MIKYGEFITPEEYMELRKMVGWVEFPIEQARACIEKAYMIQCVRDDEKAIGVVRLLWDGGYIAFLSDVIVDPKYQGQGIGRKLVEASISKLKDGMKPGYKVKLTLNSAKGKMINCFLIFEYIVAIFRFLTYNYIESGIEAS